MGRINLDNIANAKSRAQKATYELKLVPKRQLVRCEEIELHPNNRFARNDDEQSIKELSEDIKANGLISPLAVNKRGGVYRLLSGERRFKAVLLLKKEVVDCNVYDSLDDATELRILYAANLEVRKYSNAEILGYYKELYGILKKQYESGGYSGNINEEIAGIMKVSDRQVRKYALICGELSQEEQQAIADKKLSINAANKLAIQRAGKKISEPVPNSQRNIDIPEPVPNSQRNIDIPEPVPNSQKSVDISEPVPNSQRSINISEPVPHLNSQIGNQYVKTSHEVLILLDMLKKDQCNDAYETISRFYGKVLYCMRKAGFHIDV